MRRTAASKAAAIACACAALAAGACSGRPPGPVPAAEVRANSAAVAISAYTSTQLGRIPYEGTVQFRDATWQFSPRAAGAVAFSMPDSQLVSVDLFRDDTSRDRWVRFGAVAALSIVVIWAGVLVASR